jgi:hypothetical protein
MKTSTKLFIGIWTGTLIALAILYLYISVQAQTQIHREQSTALCQELHQLQNRNVNILPESFYKSGYLDFKIKTSAFYETGKFNQILYCSYILERQRLVDESQKLMHK